jgi:hypothetical protein
MAISCRRRPVDEGPKTNSRRAGPNSCGASTRGVPGIIGIMSNAPKSAYELAMEKLRKKDADAGVEEQVLTDAQREAITEARNLYESRVAERRILHQSAVLPIMDPAEREERDVELRRDLERFASERDAKIRKIRETP